MKPVTVHADISASREDVYPQIADVAARPAWCDHFAKDYRLLSPRSVGLGAGARFRLDWLGGRRYVEFTVVEAEAPERIAERGGTGRLGRTRWHASYELTEADEGGTRVEVTVSTEPENAIERLRERLGFARFLRRRFKRGLERLRRIAEEGGDTTPARASIAGYEPRKAPRFGTPSGRRFGTRSEGDSEAAERPEPGRVGE